MTKSEAARIMACARQAHSAWADLPVRHRCVVLGRLRRQLALKCESVAELIANDTAKPLLDALAGDVMVTLETMRYYETHADRILRSRKVGKPAFFFRGARFESRFEPHGVALIFGPSNYPLQLSLVPLISALAAGNSVVLKCSERTPRTAELIAHLCATANLPLNLVQVLHEDPAESEALIDARPDLIFFTGSSRNGQMVAERAAKLLIPAILELGGKDASLVFADCHLERALEGIVYGAFSNGGRVCVGVKRVYVEAPIYEKFLTRLKLRIADLRVGAGPDVDLCPAPADALPKLQALIEDALARGATLQHAADPPSFASGPVVLTDVPHDAELLSQECFGPVLCVAPFQDEPEAITLANGSLFALSGSIWTRDMARGRRVAARLSAGSCAINDVVRVIANPYAPFGGNRLSGYGRYHGPEGLQAFSRIKTVMTSSDRRIREINWFPFTRRTRRRLAMLLRFRHGQPRFMVRLNRLLIPLLLGSIMCLPIAGEPDLQTHLRIDVRLAQHAQGELGYLIFDSPAGFPGDRERAVRHGFLPIPAAAQEMHIDTDLPPGTYAVSVYEDLNRNHKLDRNLLGIPREPVGVSNNPTPRRGSPSFKESSFRLGSTARTISIKVVPGA